MRFHLVDRILTVEPGKSIRAVKHLTLAEEYLADHFPSFPVMPGVLQLQALVEAGSWLMRLTDGYAQSVWVLRETRNVKYGTFVRAGPPAGSDGRIGQARRRHRDPSRRGEVDGTQTVSAQLMLAGYNCGTATHRGRARRPVDPAPEGSGRRVDGELAAPPAA